MVLINYHSKVPCYRSSKEPNHNTCKKLLGVHVQATCTCTTYACTHYVFIIIIIIIYFSLGPCKECSMASLTPPSLPQYSNTGYMPAHYMIPTTSVIMSSSRPHPISPHHTPPPPVTPTSSVTGRVEVDQILEDLCEESNPAHSCIISPTPQHSPYSYPSHTSPMGGGRFTPTVSSMESIVMPTETTSQVKPEELERYLPSYPSPPLISYSSPINSYSPPYCPGPSNYSSS